MIIYELNKKQEKLKKIFDTLVEMRLIHHPHFVEIKHLIFEGIEKILYAIKIREIQISSHTNLSISGKHDFIVKKILKKWEEMKIISGPDCSNPGTLYCKIDCIEDFIFEMCIQGKEVLNKLINQQSLEDIVNTIDYFSSFFTVLEEVRKYIQQDNENDYKDFLNSKENNKIEFGSISLIKNIILEFLSKISENNDKLNTLKLNDNFKLRHKNLCKIFFIFLLICFLKAFKF